MFDLILLTIGFGAGVFALGFTMFGAIIITNSEMRKVFDGQFLLSLVVVVSILWVVFYHLCLNF